MMGNHDTGHDRSQERRTGRRGHAANGIKGSKEGSMELVVHTWWGSKVKAACNRETVLSGSLSAAGEGRQEEQRETLKTKEVSGLVTRLTGGKPRRGKRTGVGKRTTNVWPTPVRGDAACHGGRNWAGEFRSQKRKKGCSRSQIFRIL